MYLITIMIKYALIVFNKRIFYSLEKKKKKQKKKTLHGTKIYARVRYLLVKTLPGCGTPPFPRDLQFFSWACGPFLFAD